MAAVLLILVLIGVSVDTTHHFKSEKSTRVTPAQADTKADVTPASEPHAS